MKLPIEINHSRVPVFLSRFAPIKMAAFSCGIWIFHRKQFSTRTRNHETIHFLQQVELGFVLQWILYLTFALVGFVRYRSWLKSYRLNPFEQEAYDNDVNPYYLEERKHYAWLAYVWK